MSGIQILFAFNNKSMTNRNPKTKRYKGIINIGQIIFGLSKEAQNKIIIYLFIYFIYNI